MEFKNLFIRFINKLKENFIGKANISNALVGIFLFISATLGPLLIFLLFSIYSIIYGIFYLPKYLKYKTLLSKAKKDVGLSALLGNSFMDQKTSLILRKDILKSFKSKTYVFTIIKNTIEIFLFINFKTIEESVSQGRTIARFKKKSIYTFKSNSNDIFKQIGIHFKKYFKCF